jgi:pyrroline-5-carboxylate reductase
MEPEVMIVGGGRMGTALVRGLLDAGWRPDELTVVEQDDDTRAEIRATFSGVLVTSELQHSSGAVVSVKPPDGEAVCRALGATGTTKVMSVMAGVTLRRLETWLGPDVAAVRAMPNMAATVGAGVSAVAAGHGAGEEDLMWAERILGAVGCVVRVPEAWLDAVTGLSGSGPAYVFLMTEALVEAGERVGLPPEVSRTLALHTVAGAGRLLLESSVEPSALRAQVTSPGGTTEAGLKVLEERGVSTAFVDAVVAAARRSAELGR